MRLIESRKQVNAVIIAAVEKSFVEFSFVAHIVIAASYE